MNNETTRFTCDPFFIAPCIMFYGQTLNTHIKTRGLTIAVNAMPALQLCERLGREAERTATGLQIRQFLSRPGR